MKILSLLLLLLFPGMSFALMDQQLAVAPNRKYMNYFFEGYLPWLEKTFGQKLSIGSPEGDRFLNEAIFFLDHWRVEGKPELGQFLFGQGFMDETPVHAFRVYIHPDMREHAFIKSLSLPKKPLFVEKRGNGEICYLVEMMKDEVTWKHVSHQDARLYLGHICQGELKLISVLGKEVAALQNPFPGTAEFELRTYSKVSLESAYYFNRYTHLPRLLPRHYRFIHAHGEELLIPFDKYSVDKDGNVTVYYP